MKKSFYEIMIWISGIDTILLKDCPESEHKKYALQAGLILIPTVMATISMLYASSLLTEILLLRVVITIIWTLIIFVIDRYIVSTFVKNVDGNDWQSISFFVRIIFAIGLGVVISHPAILRIFDDKIVEIQNEIWIEIKQKTENDINKEFEIKSKDYKKRISDVVKDNDILKKVISAELVGADTLIEGYYVSKHRGKGEKIEKYANDTLKNGIELRNLNFKIDSINNFYNKKETSLIKERKDALGKGYWAKDDALELYLTKSKKWSKYYFLLLFFIFIDVTAVLLKVFTKYGEYDFKLSEREKNRKKKTQYFLDNLLNKKKHFLDKDYKWTVDAINSIYIKHQNSTHNELIDDLQKFGVQYEDEDITENKNSYSFGSIIKDINELSKSKMFYFFMIFSIIIGIIVPIYINQNEDNATSFYVTFVSIWVNTISGIFAGIFIETYNKLKK